MSKVSFVVKAIIKHPTKNKYLILKRNNNASNRPGDFDIPGGKVEKGELLQDAIVREIAEETNLKIEDLNIIFLNSNYVKEKNRYYIFAGYSAISKTQKISLNREEHSDFFWVTLEELKKIKTNHIYIQKTLEAFIK